MTSFAVSCAIAPLTVLLAVLMFCYQNRALRAEQRNNALQQQLTAATNRVEDRTQQVGLWISRAFDAGWKPELSERQASHLLRDLFPSATFSWTPVGTPSCPIKTVEGDALWDAKGIESFTLGKIVEDE